MAIGQRGVQLLRVILKKKMGAYHYDTIKRRSVTSRYHGSKISVSTRGSLSKTTATATRREKAIGLH